jgi:pyridoxal phosphate enzyme (YggS family)
VDGVTIEQNYHRVLERVRNVEQRSGRPEGSVTIVGVSKTVGRDAVDRAYSAGVRHFGENRVQDALEKFQPSLPDDATLHLIGYLQSNKARDAVSLFQIVHSVDRMSVIEALEKRAEQQDKIVQVLIQVNIAEEEQKHGCPPSETERLVCVAHEAPHLEVRGLMTIAPLVDTAEAVRPVFRGLRELRDHIQTRHSDICLDELSMGMTNDFEVAIEEGATIVRIGRAIFAE